MHARSAYSPNCTNRLPGDGGHLGVISVRRHRYIVVPPPTIQDVPPTGASAYDAERFKPRKLERGAGDTPSRQRTRVPAPGVLSTSSVAPMLDARSRMPMIP